MKIITSGNTTVAKILGKQQVIDTEYRMMQYVLQAENEDGTLLLNTITGTLVLLSNIEREVMNELPNRYKEDMKQLVMEYFLVPTWYNERETVKTLRVILNKVSYSKSIDKYTVLTTTNCNARCFYCYESGYRRINMNVQTAEKLTEFMIKHKGNGRITIEWFGGEPLLGADRIDQISLKLKASGIGFVAGITSNGYLFDETLIEKAKRVWNLDHAQITIDGTEEIYNKTKAFVSSIGSPYRKVMRNIGLLLEHEITVMIRLNLDQHNYADLRLLIDELRTTFSDYSNLYVYVHVTFRGNGYCPIERTYTEEEALYKKQIELNKYIAKVGLSKPGTKLASLKIHSCTADDEHSMIVYPDGTLFKCEHLDEKDSLGSIFSVNIPTHVSGKFMVNTEREACKSCPLFPKCIILKECPGREYRNDQTCSYDIQVQQKSMLSYYEKSKIENT